MERNLCACARMRARAHAHTHTHTHLLVWKQKDGNSGTRHPQHSNSNAIRDDFIAQLKGSVIRKNEGINMVTTRNVTETVKKIQSLLEELAARL
jgi:hypothetical protein